MQSLRRSEIERARPDDVESILDVFQLVSIETYAKLGIPVGNLRSYVTDEQFVSGLLKRWHNITVGLLPDNLFVARNEDRVTGYSYSYRNKVGRSTLGGLYSAVQGEGDGSRLLQAALAPYIGDEVRLTTTIGTAEGFYERHGFNQIHAGREDLTGLLIEALKYGVILPQVEMVAAPYTEVYQP